MKTEHKIITASFLLGVFIWFIDAVIDYLVFLEVSFWTALLGIGTDHYMRLLIMLLFVASGVFMARALTRRKQSESEILKLNSAMEQAGDGIAISNTDGKLTYVNSAYAQMHGYLPEELIGIPQRQLNSRIVTKEYRHFSLGDILRKDQDAPTELEVEHIRKDGTVFPASTSISYIKDEKGLSTGVLTVTKDITERKKAEDQLKRLNCAIEQASDGIAIVNSADWGIAYINDSYVQMLGYRMSEMIGMKFRDLNTGILTEKYKHHTLPDILKKTKARTVEVEQVRKDGSVFPALVSLAYLRDQKGSGADLIIVAKDISERREAEKRLENAYKELEQANVKLHEADRLKSIFLASMSHELRTPLNSIIGFTTLILKGMAGQINDVQREQLDLVESSAQHLLGLINDVLDISKIEAGRVELIPDPFVFNDLLSEVVHSFLPMTSFQKLELTSSAPPNIEMYNDRRRAKQVLTNLISNAVKFTDEGGVDVAASIISGKKLRVTVTDTGAGMTEEAMSRLFQPFQQVDAQLTKSREGTGLGLYLSQKLAHLMGGEITVESEYGKGSAFTFSMLLDVSSNGHKPAKELAKVHS